jgi:hypothetical protein
MAEKFLLHDWKCGASQARKPRTNEKLKGRNKKVREMVR